MKSAYLIYPIYMESDGSRRRIGGIQTYLINLSGILMDRGYKVYIIQAATRVFEVSDGNITVIGVPTKKINSSGNVARELYKYISKHLSELDLLVFCTEMASVKCNHSKTLYIQHGVSWDMPTLRRNFILKYTIARRIWKIVQNLFYSRLYTPSNEFVCVDYNYINWLRTQRDIDLNNVHFIPNAVMDMGFSDNSEVLMSSKSHATGEAVKILFARRFVDYRGSRIAADALVNLSKKFDDKISIIISGEGPDKEYFENKLSRLSNVSFTSYHVEDTLEFHRNIDIVMVPSLGSEGTSLSLIEAMRAGCAPVVTPVGGMTSIVIDGFNGSYCSPNSYDLELKLESLILGRSKLVAIQKRAIETVVNGPFHFQEWTNRWINVINKLEGGS